MSKTDDMRAMREARYAASRTAVDKPTAASKTPHKAPEPAARPEQAERPERAKRPERPEVVPETTQTGLCGHRAISGRTCTREQGHAAKSHRYS